LSTLHQKYTIESTKKSTLNVCSTEVSQSLQHWLENQSAADATEFADDEHLVTADES